MQASTWYAVLGASNHHAQAALAVQICLSIYVDKKEDERS
jgi:hypothetical protein